MSNVETIAETKRRMRADAAVTRRAAALASPHAGDGVAANFLSSFRNHLTHGQHVVSAYWPMGDELDIRPLLHQLCREGIACALPVVVGKRLPLFFRLWRPEDDLVAGPFGTSEPSPTSPETAPTVLLVPLLAFDLSGGRLGYGGGFYDRSLAGLRRDNSGVLAVGVAYDGQEIDMAPMADYDQRLDWVVTESRIIQCGT